MLTLPFVQAVILAASIVGKVVAVADGDTLTVLTADKRQVRVRLAEIDAPEKAQAFGEKSKQALSRMVFGREVRVEVQTSDRYGRSVGRVFVGDTDVNAELVRNGMAWIYVRYSRDRALLELEAAARAGRVGLWADERPTPPWEYRRAKKSPRRSAAADAPAPQSAPPECGRKRYCREMLSCAEARIYLEQCGVSSLDGDGDGVPCETLCRHE